MNGHQEVMPIWLSDKDRHQSSQICIHEFSTTYKLPRVFTPLQLSLFSITYELPNLQLLCFDNDATLGWVGGAAHIGKEVKTTQLSGHRTNVLL